MKGIEVQIEGVSPLLMHRFAENEEVQAATRKIQIKERDPREEATKAAYIAPDGTLYFPTSAIARMLREAGGGHKQRGSRKSLKYVVPAAVFLPDEMMSLLDEAGAKATHFEVDSRPVTIPATKGRIMRHRPRLNSWKATFHLEIDDDVLETSIIKQLLDEAGRKIGLGDFRPEKGGPFGRFQVTKWSEAN